MRISDWSSDVCSSDEVAREFGEFAVVADHHPDWPAVGVDRVGAIAALDVPPAALRRGRMELFLTVHRTGPQECLGKVADVTIVDPRRVRAAGEGAIIAEREAFRDGVVGLGM